VWRRSGRHHMARVGLAMLGLLVFIAVFAEFLSPYAPTQRDTRYLSGEPMLFHLFDASGEFRGPFVHARVNKRDPLTLRMTTTVDRDSVWPVRFLVTGEPYRLWGLIPMDVHLFGVERGFVHLFGTDQLGRDLFTRTLHATRVSMSIGVIE